MNKLKIMITNDILQLKKITILNIVQADKGELDCVLI